MKLTISFAARYNIYVANTHSIRENTEGEIVNAVSRIKSSLPNGGFILVLFERKFIPLFYELLDAVFPNIDKEKYIFYVLNLNQGMSRLLKNPVGHYFHTNFVDGDEIPAYSQELKRIYLPFVGAQKIRSGSINLVYTVLMLYLNVILNKVMTRQSKRSKHS